jgi:hypothetical protein
MTFKTTYWACGSNRFQETLSREFCPDCGIECRYHSTGSNEAYDEASSRRHREVEIRLEQWIEENGYNDYYP